MTEQNQQGSTESQQNAPEVTEGMTDDQAWAAIDKWSGGSNEGTENASGGSNEGSETSGQTLNLTTDQLNTRLERTQEKTQNDLLKRWQQKYPNLQNLDEVDELLESYSAAEEEEKSESERVAGERDRIAGERDTFASERDDYKGKYETLLKSQSLQNALIQKGVKPERMDMAIKNADLSGVELSQDGEVSGADKAAEELTKSVPEWFADTSRPGVPTSPDGQSGSGKLSDEEKRRMSGLDNMRL